MVYFIPKFFIQIYATFTSHFKGKRRCISGIIALLSVLRNALTRIGGEGYNLYILPPILINAFQEFSEIIFDFFDETV